MKLDKLAFVVLLLSISVWAHEGHDHNSPGEVQPQKGGVLKSLEKTHVEVLAKGETLSIFLYDKNDKDLKPQKVAPYTVTAKAEFPRSKKQKEIILTPKDTFFEAAFNSESSHRYTLMLTVRDPKTGHDDKLNFTIEPRKSE